MVSIGSGRRDGYRYRRMGDDLADPVRCGRSGSGRSAIEALIDRLQQEKADLHAERRGS